jgi:formamidopyrimidine-DNA glycosylase
VRQRRLRWPVPPALARVLPGEQIETVERRAKYLLLHTAPGAVLVHLGMSGSLRVLPERAPGAEARSRRPRAEHGQDAALQRPAPFGFWLWQPAGRTHGLLAGLGPEPLSSAFDGDYLFKLSRGRKAPVKHFLMDQRIVVGVGNIYAAEALFVPEYTRDARRAGSRASAIACWPRPCARCSSTRYAAAARRCAISSAPTASPGISSRS